MSSNENKDAGTRPVRQLEVEGSVVHIMKALASHPLADQSLIEDNTLQLLFQMVANGSVVFSQYKGGLVPLHAIQLHRHAMQIKVLLMAVKDFTSCLHNENC